MAYRELPPLDYVRQCLTYDAEAGTLTWLHRPLWMFPDERAWKSWNTNFAGRAAFTAKSNGARVGTLRKVRYLAHRVAFFLAHGEQPDGEIDHINGDPYDNRLSNLRVVTHKVNARNRARNKGVSNPAHGVYQQKTGRWWACMKVEGKFRFLGSFETQAEAVAARKGAERVLGFHPNHGRAPA